MRIKKVSGTAVLNGNVVDNLTDDSTTNAPSQRAVNEALLDTYSTEEVKTNKVWIDGKPVYRKVIQIDSMPNTSTVTYETGLNYADVHITKIYGVMTNNAGVNFPIPDPGTTETNKSRLSMLSNGELLMISIMTASDRSAFNGHVVLEYTKTTD